MASAAVYAQMISCEGESDCLVVEVFPIAIHPIVAAQAGPAKRRQVGSHEFAVFSLVACCAFFNIEAGQAVWMAFCAGETGAVGVFLMRFDRVS